MVLVVAQHRELGERPDLLERGASLRVPEIDDVRLEGYVVLVQRDQHLLAEGCEGVE